MNEKSEILIYQTDDGATKIQTLLQDETVWLSQAQMVELFQTTKQNISLHIKNIFEEGELIANSTVKDFLTVQMEGKRQVERSISYYNLDVIISVGYRVKSHRGIQFRQWATQRLKEYIVKGFVLDDERLEGGSEYDYFDELVERVRAIRASERRFYQKITDIYATSIDYDPDHQVTQDFFASVQNKFHYAIHGCTAAEMITKRADADQPYMGLTSFKGNKIKQSDITVAKNYLSEDELKSMNRIVDQYLSFAEEQAARRKSMNMIDWIEKLHGFLELNDREVLQNAGTVSAKQAKEKAQIEYKKYLKIQDKKIISDFDRTIKKQIEKKDS